MKKNRIQLQVDCLEKNVSVDDLLLSYENARWDNGMDAMEESLINRKSWSGWS